MRWITGRRRGPCMQPRGALAVEAGRAGDAHAGEVEGCSPAARAGDGGQLAAKLHAVRGVASRRGRWKRMRIEAGVWRPAARSR